MTNAKPPLKKGKVRVTMGVWKNKVGEYVKDKLKGPEKDDYPRAIVHFKKGFSVSYVIAQLPYSHLENVK